jgi:hypothetical protein
MLASVSGLGDTFRFLWKVNDCGEYAVNDGRTEVKCHPIFDARENLTRNDGSFLNEGTRMRASQTTFCTN